MRNILLLLLITLCCWNCQEEKLATFDGQNGIYFINYYRNNNTAKELYTDTTSFSFVWTTASDTVVHLGVRGLGKVMDYDRPFRVKVANTNAVAGVHYDELQSEYILKADTTYSSVPIHIYRESIAHDTTFYIEVELVANDYFVPNIPFKEVSNNGIDTIYITRQVLAFSNKMEEPEPWQYVKSFVGEWTEAKFTYINETFSLDPAIWYGDKSQWNTIMNRVQAGATFLTNYLNSIIAKNDYANYPKDPDNSDINAKGYLTIPGITIPSDWPNASEVE